MKPPTRAIMNFLLKLLKFRTPQILTKSRMKSLIAQQLCPQIGFLFHAKLITELNITSLL